MVSDWRKGVCTGMQIDCVVYASMGVPLLSEFSTAEDLVRIHETNDPRVSWQFIWYIYIAAAYCKIGRFEEARKLVNEKFGSPGLRRQYSMVFESLAALE